MNDSSVNILIGGEAGQGLATVGQLLTKGLVRGGWSVHVTQDYMSRIRGGHNTYAIRTALDPVAAPRESVDILVALNQETVTRHKESLTDKGVVILDQELDPEGARALRVPFKDLAPKPIFENVAALGVLCRLLGLPREIPEGLVKDTFGKKGQEMVDQNLAVLDKGMDWVKNENPDFEPLPKAKAGGKRLAVNGNEAIALGALAAGVKFCSFYPMTPSTSVPLTLIAHGAKMGVVVEQVEDEIAAVNMGVGASYAGARTLVPTSGGGFALMTEGVSLAGIMETPLVFVLAQRPGPATGLPTGTEQGDLNMVIYAGHGEFPRAVFAPGDIEECFNLTVRAFDQAEKHQSPVFVLTDQYLADSYRGVPAFDLDGLAEPVRPLTETDRPEEYQRYALTESGVSPRLVPGLGPYLVVSGSDEHSEDGHISEDPQARIAMQDKRLRKAEGLVQDMVPPTLVGGESPDLLLVCWGSTKGAALEAAARLNSQGTVTSALHFSQVFPLDPEQFLSTLEGAGRVVCVEGNSTGQFAALIRQHTGFVCDGMVLRYDGLPMTAKHILERIA